LDWFALLDELTAIPGPTGQEDAVMDWCHARWSDRAAELRRSPTGNLYAHVGGRGRRLLIQAHADEIGFIVRSIDDQGYLHLASAQRQDDPGKRFPIGQTAVVMGRHGNVEGLFAAASGHVLTEEQRSRSNLTYDDLWVDVGVDSKAEAEERGIHPGARVHWNPPLRRLGRKIFGKALDDRMPIALMTSLLESLDVTDLNCELHFAVTVQEENGLIGANALHLDLRPDAAIALEVGLAGDVPNVKENTMPTRLGGGPILVHKDGSSHYSRELIWELADLAESNAIPFQHAIFERFGSDGAQFIRHGIPAALVGPATRYTHSPFEMIDESDLDHTFNLLRAWVTNGQTSRPL
jgi:tetrahedral aminopeptidase